jgi:hypothetical protein
MDPINKTCLVSVFLPIVPPECDAKRGTIGSIPSVSVYCAKVIPFYDVYKKCINPMMDDVLEFSNNVFCRVNEIFKLVSLEWNVSKHESFKNLFGNSFHSSPPLDVFEQIEALYLKKFGHAIKASSLMIKYKELFSKIKIIEKRWESSYRMMDDGSNTFVSEMFQKTMLLVDDDPFRCEKQVKINLEAIMSRVSEANKSIENRVYQNELFQRGKTLTTFDYLDDSEVENKEQEQEIAQTESDVTVSNVSAQVETTVDVEKSMFGYTHRGCQTNCSSVRNVGTQVRSNVCKKTFTTSETQTGTEEVKNPPIGASHMIGSSDGTEMHTIGKQEVKTEKIVPVKPEEKIRVVIRKNKSNQYIVEGYNLVYNPTKKEISGALNSNGTIRSLSDQDKETCKLLKLNF